MELCPDAVIVARQAGDNPEKGMQITEDVMQQHPEVNVITGNNDSGPLGAVEAVKGMNLSQDILDKFYIGGGDATPEAIEKMNDETSVYRATVDIGPYDTGENCVKAIHDIIESGVMPVSYTHLETLCPERGICKNSLRSMPLIMTCVYAIFNALGIK